VSHRCCLHFVGVLNDDPEMEERANLAVSELTAEEYNAIFNWDIEKYPHN
jgi:hypothetical protein